MWTEITLPNYEPDGLRYASDMTNAEWELIEARLVTPLERHVKGAHGNHRLHGLQVRIGQVAFDEMTVAEAAHGRHFGLAFAAGDL